DGVPSERPRHRVWTDGFAIATAPVTNAAYAEYLESTGAAPPPFRADPGLSDPAQPVVGVSWAEAAAFCGWLSERAGAAHRPPAPPGDERGGVGRRGGGGGPAPRPAGGPAPPPPRSSPTRASRSPGRPGWEAARSTASA